MRNTMCAKKYSNKGRTGNNESYHSKKRRYRDNPGNDDYSSKGNRSSESNYKDNTPNSKYENEEGRPRYNSDPGNNRKHGNEDLTYSGKNDDYYSNNENDKRSGNQKAYEENERTGYSSKNTDYDTEVKPGVNSSEHNYSSKGNRRSGSNYKDNTPNSKYEKEEDRYRSDPDPEHNQKHGNENLNYSGKNDEYYSNNQNDKRTGNQEDYDVNNRPGDSSKFTDYETEAKPGPFSRNENNEYREGPYNKDTSNSSNDYRDNDLTNDPVGYEETNYNNSEGDNYTSSDSNTFKNNDRDGYEIENDTIGKDSGSSTTGASARISHERHFLRVHFKRDFNGFCHEVISPTTQDRGNGLGRWVVYRSKNDFPRRLIDARPEDLRNIHQQFVQVNLAENTIVELEIVINREEGIARNLSITSINPQLHNFQDDEIVAPREFRHSPERASYAHSKILNGLNQLFRSSEGYQRPGDSVLGDDRVASMPWLSRIHGYIHAIYRILNAPVSNRYIDDQTLHVQRFLISTQDDFVHSFRSGGDLTVHKWNEVLNEPERWAIREPRAKRDILIQVIRRYIDEDVRINGQVMVSRDWVPIYNQLRGAR